MIAIEITAAIDAAGTTTLLCVSDDRFVTTGADTPAHTAFDPLLLDPGSLGRNAFSDGRTGGATRLETGEIVLANIDGALDGWLDYGFDGRPCVIRSGSAESAYPSGWTEVLTGTIEAVEASTDKLILRLRDKQYLLDVPVCAATYGGTNILPSGLDGTADDLKGQRRPKVYGKVFNISPPCCNTSRLIYETGVCNSVDAVYDRGAALTVGAVYTSQVDMETTAPAAGEFRAWPAGGYFRLGSSATGQITADVTAGAAAANRATAQLLKQIALDVGIPSGSISSADVTALDTANAAVVGIWLQDETPALSAMDQIAASIGAWYGFDKSGTLRLGRLAAPSGTPTLTINDYEVLAMERQPARDNSIPAWKYTLSHTRNYTPQPSDVAGAVTAARRAWLAQEYRTEKAESATVKTKHLLADELTADGLLTSAPDAATESTRRLDLYKVRRDMLDVTVPLEAATASLLDTVRVIYPRFGCASGKDFRLVGIRYELSANRAVLTLWG